MVVMLRMPARRKAVKAHTHECEVGGGSGIRQSKRGCNGSCKSVSQKQHQGTGAFAGQRTAHVRDNVPHMPRCLR